MISPDVNGVFLYQLCFSFRYQWCFVFLSDINGVFLSDINGVFLSDINCVLFQSGFDRGEVTLIEGIINVGVKYVRLP